MKLSESVLYFNKLRKEYGDIDVYLNDDNNATIHELEPERIAYKKRKSEEWLETRDGKPAGTYKADFPAHIMIY